MREGWKKVRLGDVCAIQKTKHNGDPLPYVGLEHIESDTGKFLGSIAPLEVKSSTFRFSPYHVLYGRLRPYLNKVMLPDFDGHCSSEIFPLKPSDALDRRFLYYWITQHSVVKEVDKTSTGARMPRANVNQVMGFELALPLFEEQKRIIAILDEAFEGIDTVVANTEKNLANARELFESYLDRMFREVDDDWCEVPIFEHINFIDYRGKTPKKTSEGVRLITAKNVRMGSLRREPEEFIHPDDYDSWMTRGFPKKGDVLFTTEAPLGFVCQLDTDEKVALAQRIITMQPDLNVIIPEYLNYALRSRLVQARIHANATGATASGIKASLLKKILIPIAPLKKQKELVESISVIEAETLCLEVIYQQKLTALAELKQSLLQKAFSGELTARSAEAALEEVTA